MKIIIVLFTMKESEVKRIVKCTQVKKTKWKCLAKYDVKLNCKMIYDFTVTKHLYKIIFTLTISVSVFNRNLIFRNCSVVRKTFSFWENPISLFTIVASRVNTPIMVILQFFFLIRSLRVSNFQRNLCWEHGIGKSCWWQIRRW